MVVIRTPACHLSQSARTLSVLCVVVLLASLVFPHMPGASAATPPCSNAPVATTSETIVVDGTTRSYLVHAPHPLGTSKLPLVLAFHGRGESPELIAQYSQLSALAAILVYPRGLPGKGGKPSWSGTPTAAAGVDDVRFARAIVARLVRAGCVDGSRVYATGKSDGGGLAVDLACEAAGLVVAVAPVSGAYYPIDGGCRPTRPVSVLEFHGTADRLVPYLGSAKRGLPEIVPWLAAWAARDECRQRERAHTLAEGVSVRVWSACADRRTVEGVRIRGGGHTWPGSTSPSGPGATTRAIDATAAIARFFGIASVRVSDNRRSKQ